MPQLLPHAEANANPVRLQVQNLVVLKDLGLDPASKEARKMIDRVDRRLVFKAAQQPAFPSRRNGGLHQRPESSAWARISKNRTMNWPISSWASSWRMAAGIKPDSRVSDAIETVIERRHQNGRWPLNLLHPEHIPLKMETGSAGQAAGIHYAGSESCVGATIQRGSSLTKIHKSDR